MAEFDQLIFIIIPVVMSAIVSFVLLGINKLGKTSEGTLSGTIRLEHVQTNLNGLEEKMDKGFDKIELLLTEQERENRSAFTKVWARFEEFNTELRLHEYRLNQADRRRNGNGNSNGALGDK